MILTSQECIQIFKALPKEYKDIIQAQKESGISDTSTIKLRNAMILYALDEITTDTLDTDRIDSTFEIFCNKLLKQYNDEHHYSPNRRQFTQLILDNISTKYPLIKRHPKPLTDIDATALDDFTNKTLSRLSRSSTPINHPHKERSGKQQKRKATATATATPTAGSAYKKPKCKKQKRSKLSIESSSRSQDSSALSATYPFSCFNWSFFKEDGSKDPLPISGNDEASTSPNSLPIVSDLGELDLLKKLEDQNEGTDALPDSEFDCIPTDLKTLKEMAESASAKWVTPQ